MLLCFAHFLELKENDLGKNIVFIYNGCLINIKEEKNIIKYGLLNTCTITVVDQYNVFGGNNILFNKI